MNKILISLFASASIAATAWAQGGNNGAPSYQYSQTVIVSNLVVNTGMSTNLLLGPNVPTPILLHGSSQTLGLFLNGQWNVPTGANGTNKVTLQFLPATVFSQTNGVGSQWGYLIETNSGVMGANALIMSSIDQTNQASGTWTILSGGFH